MNQAASGSVRSRFAVVATGAPYALIAVGVLLGWQIAIQPIIQRAPVEAAIRVAPASPLVLRRAAEAELAAGRVENAASLGRDALARSPFDVRALRVVGLTEAQAGRVDLADEILTLAGNWSLRDDPSHAWLVEHRLRRGDFASAFAHADTLARRREDIQPQIFRLFTLAAVAEPRRVTPILASLLTARPPWRSAYITSLYPAEGGLQLAASLAVMLETGRAPMTRGELREFYGHMMDRGQIEALVSVRKSLNRPPIGAAVANGDFEDPDAPEPFQWSLIQKAGASAQVMPDDANQENHALRVEYDGFTPANIARQRVFLSPGRYRLGSASRTESGDPGDQLVWSLTCEPGGGSVLTAPAVAATEARDGSWTRAVAEFSVPQGCASQWLDLSGSPRDRRTPMVVWFDRITIVSAADRAAP